MEELAAYLDSTEGCILSTLGSKELPFLTAVHDFYERIWLRVLEADGVREYCRSLGFDEKKIIFGKGPFSEEENILHLQKSRADILVTKESGALGGYPQKAEAARKLGAELVTVKRPEETGMVIGAIKKMILIRKKK
jgi:precorrin-6Y C5,15-methyltransferase (decarboxylating)/precorrin-6A/cobalt-precorrin-6A reductase